MEENRFKKQVRDFYEDSQQEKKKKKGKYNQPKGAVNPWELVEKQGKGISGTNTEEVKGTNAMDEDASASVDATDSKGCLERQQEIKLS